MTLIPLSGFRFPGICLVRLGPHEIPSANEVCLGVRLQVESWGSPSSPGVSWPIIQGTPRRGSPSVPLASPSHQGLKSTANEGKGFLYCRSLLSQRGWKPQLGNPKIRVNGWHLDRLSQGPRKQRGILTDNRRKAREAGLFSLRGNSGTFQVAESFVMFSNPALYCLRPKLKL